LVIRIEGSAADITATLGKAGVNLAVDEALRVKSLIGRDPTLTELYIFDTMWSEHCSYKSSREVLRKYLPTTGSRVVLGPGEDAGVVRLGDADGASYVLVVAHESHNHPSQILPIEGAATGIGGIVRDVYCMGADVVGVMDALRFGDPGGVRSEAVKEIASGVVTGIWEYGNALGVPNLGGDVFFDGRYDENCLVNVIAIGVARDEDIIRSRVPPAAAREPYDLLLVGKPTDMSGLGGATMASKILDMASDRDLGAVQLHDPFLKRVLTEATKAVLRRTKDSGSDIGFKDLGAGGISCAVSEMVGAGGFGASLDLDKVHVAFPSIDSFAIACSETQERYCFAVPAHDSEALLRIFNEDFELPHIYRGARASIIGKVTPEKNLVMTRNREVVADLPVDIVNQGICYRRPSEPRPRPERKAVPVEIPDIKAACLAVLSLPSVCSKHYIYRHYDSEVKGLSVLKPGEADAGVVMIPGTCIGVAATVDGNPAYCSADPYLGGIYAVCESMRNLACVGAVPIALTDCLNFGNPEDPYVMHDFEQTVRGIGDAAKALVAYGTDEPVPVVSGNVSFYNESSSGSAVPPSPIVGCYGVLDDYSVAVGHALKSQDSDLVLVGRPGPGLGASALVRAMGLDGAGGLPDLDLDEECKAIHAVTEIMRGGYARGCHDIAEGGLLVTVAEMVMGGWGMGRIGAELDLDFDPNLDYIEMLFSERGGFVLEVAGSATGEVARICQGYGIQMQTVGRTAVEHLLAIAVRGQGIVTLDGEEMARLWWGALEKAMR
jgi:phosphoribosylformylglycinamidine synthase